MKKNQGFSLIELIVVIAIMAILVGVLAPAYLRYVEKSRRSTDVDTVSEIMGAAEKVASEAQYDKYITNGTTFTISVTNATSGTLGLTVGALAETDGDRVVDAWTEMANFNDNVKLTSKAFKANAGSSSVIGTVGKDGNITWAGSGLFAKGQTDKEGEYFTSYSPDFEKKLAS